MRESLEDVNCGHMAQGLSVGMIHDKRAPQPWLHAEKDHFGCAGIYLRIGRYHDVGETLGNAYKSLLIAGISEVEETFDGVYFFVHRER
jgi:hypothetical protein